MRLANLAACLREAGGLTKAFRLGASWPYYLDSDDFEGRIEDMAGSAWRPGCGRAAPGFEPNKQECE